MNRIRETISKYFFLLLIIGLIVLIAIYGFRHDMIELEDTEKQEITLNQEQRTFLEKDPVISIYVDETLRFLLEEDGSGFLQDYLMEIFLPAGVKVRLTDQKDADCQLMVITDEIRNSAEDVSYTSPVFQIEGAFFTRPDLEEKKELSGTVMAGRMSDREMGKIHYRGKSLSFIGSGDAADAVELAMNEKLDFIIGDRSAILDAMEGRTAYIASEEVLYSRNVCIMLPESKAALYGILNQCIQQADRHHLTYLLGEKWLNGDGPLYMKDSYEDTYLLILVIFTAVLIAFFLYYQANKNLYHELNDRMKLLTESKHELKTTFNGVAYYLAELDLDGSITDINRAFYNFVNNDTANQKIWNVFNMDQQHQSSLETLVEDAAKGVHVDGIEILLNNRVLTLKIFPIENAKGIVEKLLFMGMDVTSERMAERQLLQDNKMIAVGQLAAGVAHEIRNPLGIIRNYCYVLKNMEDDDVKEKAIEQIEKAVENSGAIINSLLDFSRIPTHRSQRINIEEHISSLVVLNRNILSKKNINLSIICPEPVEAYLPVESLDMILINLISNATDAMTDNGSLTISVIKHQDQFSIEVLDTGCGIEEGILQDIFNPFFTTKGSTHGTGLGLYIVYNEVQKMNGTITVESKQGDGACFRLQLPFGQDEQKEERYNE